MDYKVLYRKYRPEDFSAIIGQEYMVSILKNAIKRDKIAHAYIFSGPRGTGKTSTAKVFAKAINCLNPTENGPCNECSSCINFKENADIIEIDAASNNGVDEIRELINNIKLAPNYSKYKVYIIDEVHMLSTSAFNALLLTLEEPPKHVVFILATTNIEAVPITILSRCQRFDFHKISLNDITKRLTYVVNQEKITIEADALEEIAYISDGGLRDALSILDQLSSNKDKITMEDVSSHFGSVSKKQINTLFTYIKENNVDEFVELIKNFKSLFIDYKLLIKKILDKIEEEAILCKKNTDQQTLKYDELTKMAFDLANISNYVSLNIDPYILIEITLLKYFSNNKVNEETTTEKTQNEAAKKVGIISREIIPNKKYNDKKILEIETDANKKAEIISREIISNTNQEEKIRIRINNCFVNAKKEYLQNIQNKWEEFIKRLDNKHLNLMEDSKVVAASDKNIIITSSSLATMNLINNITNEIEEEIEKNLKLKYNIIALCNERWQVEKQTYIKNLQNKYKYEYIDENNIINKDHENIDNMEKIAYDIFDKEKIELE